MHTVNSVDYYSRITTGRDINKLPANATENTTVGYQYDGLTEEDRFVRKVLKEHYQKMYKENLSHSDSMAYIRSKYCDVTSPNFCSYMTKEQRTTAYLNEKRMLETGGKHTAGFGRYDYALRGYEGIYIRAVHAMKDIREIRIKKNSMLVQSLISKYQICFLKTVFLCPQMQT